MQFGLSSIECYTCTCQMLCSALPLDRGPLYHRFGSTTPTGKVKGGNSLYVGTRVCAADEGYVFLIFCHGQGIGMLNFVMARVWEFVILSLLGYVNDKFLCHFQGIFIVFLLNFVYNLVSQIMSFWYVAGFLCTLVICQCVFIHFQFGSPYRHENNVILYINICKKNNILISADKDCACNLLILING